MMPEPAPETETGERPGLSVLDRVIVVIVGLTLATTCLFISAGRSYETKTGYQDWRVDSVLRSVTELLNFNYLYPTISGAEVKWLTHGLGIAALVIAATVAWFTRSRRDGTEDIGADAETPQPARTQKLDIPPLALAQIALVLLTLWMAVSAAWSSWPDASLGEAFRHITYAVWALVLARTLSRQGVRGAVAAMAVVLALTAAFALWYHHERSPFMRLEVPIGNPLFMAACLLAGIAACGAVLFGVFAETMDRSRLQRVPALQCARSAIRDMGGGWMVAGALAGLVVMAWALRLTESRGAQWALVAGVAAAVWLVSARSIRVALPVLGAVIVVVFVALNWSALSTGQSGRDATIRLRLHAWRYAGQMFAESPIVGHGQGSYLLEAQQKQAADMERDPAAFLAPVLGHAHNEYLQVAAELGIIGFLLCMGFIVMTFWAAVHAWSRAKTPLDRWLMAGLLAAFTAIVVEEIADVALRKPGLPAVFYTTVGLLWAMSLRLLQSPGSAARPRPQPVRVAGLVGGFAVALAICASTWRNWEGALACYQVKSLLEDSDWDSQKSNQAMLDGHVAATWRSAVEDFVEAYFNVVRTAMFSASKQTDQCLRLAARLDGGTGNEAGDDGELATRLKEESQMRANLVQMIREDAAVFQIYVGYCEGAGRTLLGVVPGYPDVAGMLAELQLLRQQMESIEQKAGLRQEVRDYRQPARELFQVELDRNPQNLIVAMRLLNLSQDQPLAYRIDLIRRPLRRGPVRLDPTRESFAVDPLSEIEPVLVSMMNEEGFGEAIQQFRAGVEQAAAEPNVARWPDLYAPETLRLMARANKLVGHFSRTGDRPGAAEMAGDAAELSKRLGGRFPGAVSNARLDQSRYLLLAQKPAEAVAACSQAIQEWPNVRERDLQLRPVWQTRVLYQLAADSEQEGRQTLAGLYPEAKPEELDRRIGIAYGELCEAFTAFPPQSRPAAYAQWVARAVLLHPGLRTGHVLAARLAAEQGDKLATVEHLKTAASLSFAQNDDSSGVAYLRAIAGVSRDATELGSLIRELATRHPTNPSLQRLLAMDPASLLPPATAPAGTLPSTTPASQPAGTATRPANSAR